jgi:hypothetical protein
MCQKNKEIVSTETYREIQMAIQMMIPIAADPNTKTDERENSSSIETTQTHYPSLRSSKETHRCRCLSVCVAVRASPLTTIRCASEAASRLAALAAAV